MSHRFYPVPPLNLCGICSRKEDAPAHEVSQPNLQNFPIRSESRAFRTGPHPFIPRFGSATELCQACNLLRSNPIHQAEVRPPEVRVLRVYKNMTATWTLPAPGEDPRTYVDYNLKMRPGCAVWTVWTEGLRDGRWIVTAFERHAAGYLSPEELDRVQAALQRNEIRGDY